MPEERKKADAGVEGWSECDGEGGREHGQRIESWGTGDHSKGFGYFVEGWGLIRRFKAGEWRFPKSPLWLLGGEQTAERHA